MTTQKFDFWKNEFLKKKNEILNFQENWFLTKI